jgi:hypothetical protein
VKIKYFFSAFFILLIVTQSLYSQQFMTVGGRAAGMGGAYVAVADDLTAVYWNPAAASLINRNVTGAFAGADASDIGGLTDIINDMADFDLGVGDVEDPETVEDALDLLERLQAGGLRANGQGDWGFSLSSSGFAFSLMQLYYSTVYPVVYMPDPTEVVDWEEELLNNESAINFRGLKTREFTMTSSRKLGTTVYVGSNLKYIQARTYASEKGVFDGWGRVSLQDLVKDAFNENEVKDSAFGIDFGFLFLPMRNLRVGLVCRNLNSPSFNVEGDREKIKLARQWRLGFAFGPPSSYTLAVDLDLSDNIFTEDYPAKNKELAIGFEKRFFRSVLGLRGGYNRKIGDGENLNTYTAGLGAAVGAFHFEIGGAYALEGKSMGLSGTMYYVF